MKILIFLLAAASLRPPAWSPEARPGPVISDFGAVYSIEGAAEVGDSRDGARAVFDVAIGSEDPAALNARIETVARFLNMHAAAGFPEERLKAVLVLHGSAARDALDDEAFEKRFGVDNPNLPLLAALADAGVEVYLCGQSAAHRGFAPDEIAGAVDVALSAMTVLIQKQAEGYGLIAF